MASNMAPTLAATGTGAAALSVESLSDEDIEVADAVGMPGKRAQNWPQLKFLCTIHKEKLFKFFRAIDEFHCTSELNATNSNNPKGNKWNRLYDHCYGGGSPGQGLLAGHLPKMSTASKLKQKAVDIWAFLKKESDRDYIIMDMDLIQTALRQEMEYEKTKADDKAAAEQQKNIDKILVEKMQGFQAELGSLPPGAKGTVGAGRRGHSTNLHTNQPATYAYANITTRPDCVTVEKSPPPPKKKATSVNTGGGTLEQLGKLEGALNNGINKLLGLKTQKDKDNDGVRSGSKRKRILYERQAALKDNIMFYQKFPNDPEFQEAMAMDMKAFRTIADDIKKCLIEEEEQDHFEA